MTVIRRDKAAIRAAADRDKKRDEIPAARDYLAATDWYVIRLVETGKPIPGDVKAARDAARTALN